MRSIAIPVADRQECVIALDVAFALGQSLGSDVVGYHMRPSREHSKKIDISDLWSAGGLPQSAWPEENEEMAKEAAVSAQKLFNRMAGEHGYETGSRHGTTDKPRAIFREKVGSPDKLIPLFGPTSDLMVVSRPRKGGGVKAWTIMMTALLEATVPVLVLPQKKANIDCSRVAVAWNRGRTESMLVHACLPLLKAAEDVVFISEGKDHKHGPSAKDMCAYLQAHGIQARHQFVDESHTARALVNAARHEKANMLLSGAYTRGRLREVIFGGVTEYLLTDTDFPVLLFHN